MYMYMDNEHMYMYMHTVINHVLVILFQGLL